MSQAKIPFFPSFFSTHHILEGEHHITLMRENEGHYSNYHYRVKLPAAISFKAVSSTLESLWCLAHPRNLPCSHVLKELLCRREIWSEWLRRKTPKQLSKSRVREHKLLLSQGDTFSYRSWVGQLLQGMCPHLPGTGLDKNVIQPATNYQPSNKDCPLFFMPALT